MAELEDGAVQADIGFFPQILFPGAYVQDLIVGVTQPRQDKISLDPLCA